MTVYRLHSSRYHASSGDGAAIRGGRWNPSGTPVIYAAASASLAVLEVLVHYSSCRTTPFSRPSQTREYGYDWVKANELLALRVASSVVKVEAN